MAKRKCTARANEIPQKAMKIYKIFLNRDEEPLVLKAETHRDYHEGEERILELLDSQEIPVAVFRYWSHFLVE